MEKGRNAAHREHSHNELTRTEREQTNFNTQGNEDYQDTGETNQSRQSLRGKRTMAGNVKWEKTRYYDNIRSSKHRYELQIKNNDTQNTQKNKQSQSAHKKTAGVWICASWSQTVTYQHMNMNPTGRKYLAVIYNSSFWCIANGLKYKSQVKPCNSWRLWQNEQSIRKPDGWPVTYSKSYELLLFFLSVHVTLPLRWFSPQW